MMTERAFSTLELLTALGICLPLLAALSVGLTSEIDAYRALRKQHAEESTLLRVEELLQHAALDGDSAPWAPAHRIHRNGRVSLYDGTPNNIMSAAAARRPLAGSDAITSASYDLEHSLSVRTAHLQGSVLRVTACPRYRAASTPRKAASLLGLSADGAFEVLPREREITPGSGCRTLRLRAAKSMLTPAASLLDLRLIRLLVPIIRLRTLYIDRDGQLRHLSHRGSENSENQPVLSGMETMRLRISNIAPWNILALHASVRSKSGGEIDFWLLPSFARASALNFSLNRP